MTQLWQLDQIILGYIVSVSTQRLNPGLMKIFMIGDILYVYFIILEITLFAICHVILSIAMASKTITAM